MKVLLFANTDWYLYNFRRSLAAAIRGAGHEVVLVSPPGPHGSRLLDQGFRWIDAPMQRRSLNPLREAGLVHWLSQLIRRERADLVHGFTIKCAVYGSIAARMAGARGRVNSVAGMGYVFTSNDPRALALRPVVRTLLRIALNGDDTRLILQNPDDVELFRAARLVDECNVRLILGSGVDCERFRPRVGPRADGPMRVLLPARLLWDKGLAEYVHAARRLRRAGRDIRMLLAGDPDPGNPAAVPEAVVRGWVKEGVIEWLGHVDDMPGLFGGVDVVTLPSYREGLPKGLIEAAACGLPLVTTDVPGCREVVAHGRNGLLVPAKDGDALADALARLHDTPVLQERFGATSRQRALTEFDERIVIARTLEVYRELLGMPG